MHFSSACGKKPVLKLTLIAGKSKEKEKEEREKKNSEERKYARIHYSYLYAIDLYSSYEVYSEAIKSSYLSFNKRIFPASSACRVVKGKRVVEQ